MKSKFCVIITILAVFVFSTLFVDAATTKSPFNSKTYTHSSLNSGELIYNGIDVSTWQNQIDWKKVKASGKVDFAFIRMGYRGNTNGNLYRDSWYERNISGANSNGIPVGVYFFSTAITTSEAEKEAKYLVDNVKGHQVDLPLIIDFEFQSGYRNTKALKKTGASSRKKNTDIVTAFCKKVKSYGYDPMVYADKNVFSNYLNPPTLINKGYDLWLAQYNTKPTLNNKIKCWQYTSSGQVSGISDKSIDCNFFYDTGEFFSNKVRGFRTSGNGTDSITLSWNTRYGASAYNIYRSSCYGGTYTKIGQSTTTSFTDSGLQKGREYYYKVAVDLPSGEKSDRLAAYTYNDMSGIIKTTAALNMRARAGTGYKKLMTIPKGGVASVVATTIGGGNQKWYKVTYKKGNVNKTGYVSGNYCTLYTVMKTSGTVNLYSEPDTASQVIDSVAGGKLVRIRSTDSNVNMCKITVGKGASTVTGWVDRNALVKSDSYKSMAKVAGLKRSSFEKNFVTIKWNKVTGADKYAVYRAKAYNGTYKKLGYSSTTSFKNTSVNKGTTYYYRVYPINQFETGPVSDKLTAWSRMGESKKGITKRKVPMRLHAGSQYKKLKTVPKNYKLNVSSYTLDRKGNRWYKVSYKKKIGYVIGNSVRLK